MTEHMHTIESKAAMDLCKDHFLKRDGSLHGFFQAMKRVSHCYLGHVRMSIPEASLKLLKEIEEGKHE